MQKINVPDWYCTNIHAGLKITLNSNSGKFTVSTCAKTPVTFDIDDHRVFDHPKLLDFRNLNLSQQILPGKCSGCHPSNFQTCENRSSSNELYLKDNLLQNQTGPKLITFLISTVCNLACTTCGAGVSSKWGAITKSTNKFSSADPESLRSLIRNINLDNLETVHIFGGEPFADPVNDIILEELSQHGKNITVWYDTNGTFVPNEQTMRLWEKFHLIRLKFSIDGVDDSFEYLRWPGKWNKVQKNILHIKQNCPSNVMFGFRPSIGLLNLHVINNVRNWFLQEIPTNREGDLSEFEYNGVYGIFSAENMPEKMKNDILSIYSVDDPVMRIINSWTNAPSDQVVQQIKNQLINIDRLRGTDYVKSLPYLTKYF